MSPQSAEYTVIKTCLDWLLDLPWNILSEDQLNISNARTILDEDHYGLADVKERIIEHLAVHNLLKTRNIEIDGYTEYEKVQIAKRHLLTRQLKGHGLHDGPRHPLPMGRGRARRRRQRA